LPPLPPTPPNGEEESAGADADAVHSWPDWEQELLWTELLLLTGSRPLGGEGGAAESVLDRLAHAWGRPPGFHREFVSRWIGERRSRIGAGAPEEAGAAAALPSDDEEDDEDLDNMDGIDDGCFYDDGYDADDGMAYPLAAAGPDAWDDACYAADSYDEALAAELLLDHLASTSPPHTPVAAPDGLELAVDRRRARDGGADGSDGDADVEFGDDNDGGTDDASASSREDAKRPVVEEYGCPRDGPSKMNDE
jgi:hypothetical protein